jgi:hypothetical protein
MPPPCLSCILLSHFLLSMCLSLLQEVEPPRRLSEERRGGLGVGSTHSPPQALGTSARFWERTEWLSVVNAS